MAKQSVKASTIKAGDRVELSGKIYAVTGTMPSKDENFVTLFLDRNRPNGKAFYYANSNSEVMKVEGDRNA